MKRNIYSSQRGHGSDCGIWNCTRDGVKFYFTDNEFYFKRSSFYGNFDDGERFAFFGRAVVELMSAVGFYPDIMHANDWQSALSVIYLKRKYYWHSGVFKY